MFSVLPPVTLKKCHNENMGPVAKATTQQPAKVIKAIALGSLIPRFNEGNALSAVVLDVILLNPLTVTWLLFTKLSWFVKLTKILGVNKSNIHKVSTETLSNIKIVRIIFFNFIFNFIILNSFLTLKQKSLKLISLKQILSK
uniref:Uncharacterized protein n=1 Tax=Inonotus obliquus TaxID=167356 RepID=A0A5A4UA72_9AGAM|nr:hypothetical protein [Inonotus obliquus]BBN21274.1 hypothetical protein [Inonotus obliquus]